MSMQVEVSSRWSVLELAIWRNRLILTIVTLHLLGALAVSTYAGVSFWSETTTILINVLFKLIVLVAANILIWRFAYAIFYARPKKPIQWLVSDLRSFVLSADKMTDSLVCFLAVAVMATSFSFLKDMIPVINPFSWDIQFAQLDRVIHGGTDPWRLLWPVFGTPYATMVMSLAYSLWFFLIYACVFVAAFDRRTPKRGMVYLVAFALTWIIGGNVFATLLSSVGPVYYEAFGFGTEFAEQMQRLHELDQIVPISALEWQHLLLQNYHHAEGVRGISAMPSMHVGTTMVMMLFAFSYARWLGWIMAGYLLLILVSSVHLGWHYAVDGYFAIGLALLMWQVAKKLTQRFSPADDDVEIFDRTT